MHGEARLVRGRRRTPFNISLVRLVLGSHVPRWQVGKGRRGSAKATTSTWNQPARSVSLGPRGEGCHMGSVIVVPTGAASTTRQGLTQFEGISAESAGARALCATFLRSRLVGEQRPIARRT
jgi:hypothetical protein